MDIDILKEICADYSIPIDAENRIEKIVNELLSENKILRAEYGFYRSITHSLIDMVEQIKNLEFKGDTGDGVKKCLNNICDSLSLVRNSEAEKFIRERLLETSGRNGGFDDEIL